MPPDLHKGRLDILVTGSTRAGSIQVGGLGGTVRGQGPVLSWKDDYATRHLGEPP